MVWPSGDQAGDPRAWRDFVSFFARPPVGRDDVDVRPVVPVAVGGAVRGERDARAVRRPGRRAVVPVAVRDLARLAAVQPDDEEMDPAIEEARAVEAVLDAADVAEGRRVRAVQDRGLVGRADARGEGDLAAVRAPGDAVHALQLAGEPPGLAASGRQDVDLARVVGVAVREEGEPAAVRRPGAATIAAGPAGQLAGLAAGVRHRPDGGAVRFRFEVDAGARERDGLAIW